MAIPSNKDELLIAIDIHYERLKGELSTISEALAQLQTLDGHAKGTLMSVNNLVAYLIGWGKLVLKWHGKKEKHEPVDFPETGYQWNELGELAQKFYREEENESLVALIGKLDETVKTIRMLIISKSNRELYEVNWYKQWSLGRMIQLNTSSPYANARARIRKWKKNNSAG